MLYAIVALLVIILDQWLKYWVAGNIALNSGAKELIPGVLSLVNIHNEGAAFGFLSGGNARIYFIIICGVFTVAVIIALATNFISGSLGRWSAVFIMAGGIGNCIDRILYGFVQDMFKMDLPFLSWFPIFNVADIFITVFCFVFILYILFGGEKSSARKRRREEDDYYDEDDEEEDERPVRRRKKDVFDEEDDEEEEDEPVRPVFKRREKEEPSRHAAAEKQPARKSRQPKYEQEYEQFKAARAARQQQTFPEPAQKAPVVDPSDPFAEWERANSRVEAQKKASAPVQPAQPSVQIPVQPQQPAAPVPQAPAAAPAPAKKSSDGLDFDLDDILNEFK